jgi:hypothetical protein
MPRTALNLLQKLVPPLARVSHVEKRHAAVTETRHRGASVIAVMPLAGDDPDGVAGAGQFHDAFGQPPPDQFNYTLSGLARRPSGFFPLPHLLD